MLAVWAWVFKKASSKVSFFLNINDKKWEQINQMLVQKKNKNKGPAKTQTFWCERNMARSDFVCRLLSSASKPYQPEAQEKKANKIKQHYQHEMRKMSIESNDCETSGAARPRRNGNVPSAKARTVKEKLFPSAILPDRHTHKHTSQCRRFNYS